MRLTAAALLLVLLAACGPNDIFECKTKAAQAPTAAGVVVAQAACQEKFGLPELDVSEFRKPAASGAVPR